ncbi:ABC transporter permease (plasmid) [Shinella sp. H4-D48]|jgi:peptide/nickel transport system permease protein|uniref:ABC transporter permease n=1 Tax=Shinella sedimenti TaxID=2919913 RepID=A0ABT0CNG1_9HYPH|nr:MULTISPECIES: ABC transporter permease [Shinella]MCJ8150151.1 ABC transporter permease [Shinella sedimenti]UNK40508.1 ABC transporter permease [Shinella sp. H4-D48]
MAEASSDTTKPVEPSLRERIADNDIFIDFKRNRLVMFATALLVLILGASLLAPWIAPTDPFDPLSLDIMNSNLPPVWQADGQWPFLLGTDDQGRDMLSAVLYGLRVSIIISALGVFLAAAIGICLGVLAGYFGGFLDAFIMRVADIQLTFPAILIALLIDGLLHGMLPSLSRESSASWVIIISIGLSFWVQYARTIRSSTMVERKKDYVNAARLFGLPPVAIMARHILPNVMGPVLVILTINFGLAIITEATLSYLGVGLPPMQPSLGTLIRIGQEFLFSGEWWIVAFPGIALAALVLTINLLGDWLRDALNPRLR